MKAGRQDKLSGSNLTLLRLCVTIYIYIMVYTGRGSAHYHVAGRFNAFDVPNELVVFEKKKADVGNACLLS